MSYQHGWTMSDETAVALVGEAHITCIECGGGGCTGCPSAFCELPLLVEHAGEHMHEGCKGAFDRHMDNAAIPLAVDEEETTPIDREPMALVVGARLR
jgi:hypothetical protein